MAVKTMDLGQVAGSSAYQEAQAGGYTGTKEEFQEDLAGIGDAGKAFIIYGGSLTSQSFTPDKTKDEILAAIQAGKQVILRRGDNIYFVDYQFLSLSVKNLSTFFYFSQISAETSTRACLSYSDGDNPTGLYSIIAIPTPSTAAPKASGIASAGTMFNFSRADHVHPSEHPKATLVTLSAASWDADIKAQTVGVSELKADGTKQPIYATPYFTDIGVYESAGIQLSALTDGKATFICESVPVSNVKVWVVVEDVEDVTPPHCLTFSSPNSFTLNVAAPGWDGTMEYSTDKSTWATWDGSKIAAVNDGGNYDLYLRGTGNTKVTGSVICTWTLTGSNIACSGNIEALLDYTTVAAGNHPAMAASCCDSLFYGCTGLTTAPALPATTLADNCYSSMFYDCTGLTTAPALPATTLASYCYGSMFSGCTGLTTAPALPATTLADSCYDNMFYGCTGLTTAPALPATTLADSCYINMFRACTGLTTAPALPATTLADNCYGSMFSGCTGLTTVPALPATTLASYCYRSMFSGCTKLKLSATQTGNYTKTYRIPTSGAGTTANSALTNMFLNTGGTFTGTPVIDTTYYLDESNSIV